MKKRIKLEKSFGSRGVCSLLAVVALYLGGVEPKCFFGFYEPKKPDILKVPTKGIQ